MTSERTQSLQKIALETLTDLVTDEGIFASSAKGAIHGRFHGLFGRDTLYTTAFIMEAEKLTGKQLFLKNSIKSVLRLSEWQGTKNDPILHEQSGKIPHEVREDPKDYEHLIQGRIKLGLPPFYMPKNAKAFINWYSNESTPLWIIIVSELIQTNNLYRTPKLNKQLRNALMWCLQNIKEFGGFAGYRKNLDNPWYELGNQSWKDGKHSYLIKGNIPPKHPIKSVGVNAIMWAALMHGAALFVDDKTFSTHLSQTAMQLKTKFNSKTEGFLMQDNYTKWYFAEALDGNNNQLRDVCIDPGLALWATVNGECIIESKYIPAVVARLVHKDLFDPQAGIGIYSSEGTIFDPIGYHRGPYTYWPFITGLVGWGLYKHNYSKEGKQVLHALLNGIEKFGHCIELFLKKDNKYVLFVKPETGAVSSRDQAWTAGAIYYALAQLSETEVHETKRS